MKTLRISDEAHKKLTATLGTIMAQTGKMQTYQDAMQALLDASSFSRIHIDHHMNVSVFRIEFNISAQPSPHGLGCWRLPFKLKLESEL
jgi:hypothetical protein